MKTKKAISPVPVKRLSDRESNFLLGLACMIVAGIFYSTALVTISMAGLVLLSIRHFSIPKSRQFFLDFRMFPYVLLFLLVFLSGGNSSDQDLWKTAVIIKLPFLVLPAAIFMLPGFDKKIVIHLHYWLLIVTTIVGIPVLFNALVNYQEILELLSKGQHIPTPIEAVKYSMFNAYAVMTGIVLLLEGPGRSEKVVKWMIGGTILFLMILMHVLAVRTGLVIVYVSIFVYGYYFVFQRPSRKSGLGIIAGLILIAVILFITIPSIRQKIGYMQHDWNQYEEGRGDRYSDSERMMSYRAGFMLWKKSPVMGVGYGDVRAEMHDFYTSEYGRVDLFKLPHSQFLLTLAGGGILGMFMLLAGLYTPVMQFRRPHLFRSLLLFLYFNYTLSFLVENSLERSMSVAFFLVLALLLIKGLDNETKIEAENI